MNQDYSKKQVPFDTSRRDSYVAGIIQAQIFVLAFFKLQQEVISTTSFSRVDKSTTNATNQNACLKKKNLLLQEQTQN